MGRVPARNKTDSPSTAGAQRTTGTFRTTFFIDLHIIIAHVDELVVSRTTPKSHVFCASKLNSTTRCDSEPSLTSHVWTNKYSLTCKSTCLNILRVASPALPHVVVSGRMARSARNCAKKSVKRHRSRVSAQVHLSLFYAVRNAFFVVPACICMYGGHPQENNTC